jgi:hypothetical protein
MFMVQRRTKKPCWLRCSHLKLPRLLFDRSLQKGSRISMPRKMKSLLRARSPFTNLILALAAFHCLSQYVNLSSAWLHAPSLPIPSLFWKTMDITNTCRLRWHCHNRILPQRWARAGDAARGLWATKDNEQQQRSQLDEASWRETKNHTNDDCAAIDHPQQQQQQRRPSPPPPLPRYDLGLGKNRPKQGEQEEEQRRASQPHLAAQTTTSNGVGWLTPNQTIFTAQNWMVPESVVKPLSSATTTTSSSSLGVTKIDHRPNSYTLQTAAVAQQQSQSAHTSQSSSSSSQLSPLEEGNVVPQDKDSFQTIGNSNVTKTFHRVVEKQPVTTRRMVA